MSHMKFKWYSRIIIWFGQTSFTRTSPKGNYIPGKKGWLHISKVLNQVDLSLFLNSAVMLPQKCKKHGFTCTNEVGCVRHSDGQGFVQSQGYGKCLNRVQNMNEQRYTMCLLAEIPSFEIPIQFSRFRTF